MKPEIKRLIVFLWFIINTSCSNETEIGIEMCFIDHLQDAYDYPIKPGMAEWEKLNSSDEMDSVLQIPEAILHSISTEGLIETVLNYPMFGNLYFIDDYQQSFDLLEENFNGFQELLNRTDAGRLLFDRYKLMHPGCKENNWPSINGPGSSASYSFAFIEILILKFPLTRIQL